MCFRSANRSVPQDEVQELMLKSDLQIVDQEEMKLHGKERTQSKTSLQLHLPLVVPWSMTAACYSSEVGA